MKSDFLESERQHLAQLLEALQRCSYFLHCSTSKLVWPLSAPDLYSKRKDTALFETLAAMNERFAKLQDTLAAAMRHTALLMSEPTDSFLKVLVFFEKLGVISSVELWQQSRAIRNIAAHDYETNYEFIAEHFNTQQQLCSMLYQSAFRLIETADQALGVKPATQDFSQEFGSLF
jgi:hypothetical protein